MKAYLIVLMAVIVGGLTACTNGPATNDEMMSVSSHQHSQQHSPQTTAATMISPAMH